MMKSNRTATYLLLAIGWVAAVTSCIRVDYDDCPPLSVQVVVKDKNYSNVNKVDLEDALPEDLPFKSYVPNLTYTMKNLKTGEVVAQKALFDVPDGIERYDIPLAADLPYGTYELTVWGGINEREEPLDADGEMLKLTPDGVEGGDPYLTRDTLVYDYQHNSYTVEMERIKGKLIVETWFLPHVAVASTNEIDHLRNFVAADFTYSGQIALRREADWSAAEDYMVWKSILPPSINDKLTVLDIDFRDAEGNVRTEILPKDVNITMNRNALTVLRYVWTWNDDSQHDGYWTVYILVNDNWEIYHGMIVD